MSTISFFLRRISVFISNPLLPPQAQCSRQYRATDLEEVLHLFIGMMLFQIGTMLFQIGMVLFQIGTMLFQIGTTLFQTGIMLSQIGTMLFLIGMTHLLYGMEIYRQSFG